LRYFLDETHYISLTSLGLITCSSHRARGLYMK